MDKETGLYNFPQRYYDSRNVKWLTLDPMGPMLMTQSPGSVTSLNWYNYCGNNPVMYHDPEGLHENTMKNARITGQQEKDANYTGMASDTLSYTTEDFLNNGQWDKGSTEKPDTASRDIDTTEFSAPCSPQIKAYAKESSISVNLNLKFQDTGGNLSLGISSIEFSIDNEIIDSYLYFTFSNQARTAMIDLGTDLQIGTTLYSATFYGKPSPVKLRESMEGKSVVYSGNLSIFEKHTTYALNQNNQHIPGMWKGTGESVILGKSLLPVSYSETLYETKSIEK